MKVLCIELGSGKVIRSLAPCGTMNITADHIYGYMLEEIHAVWLEGIISGERISPLYYPGQFITREILTKIKEKSIVIPEEMEEEIRKDLKYVDVSICFVTTTGKILRRGEEVNCIPVEIY